MEIVLLRGGSLEDRRYVSLPTVGAEVQVDVSANGTKQLQGPAYYACWDCGHKGPAVDCTGRTSEECRSDHALNTEMKRLWNEQKPHNA